MLPCVLLCWRTQPSHRSIARARQSGVVSGTHGPAGRVHRTRPGGPAARRAARPCGRVTRVGGSGCIERTQGRLASTKMPEWPGTFASVNDGILAPEPPRTRADELALEVPLTGNALEAKIRALKAQASQTTGLRGSARRRHLPRVARHRFLGPSKLSGQQEGGPCLVRSRGTGPGPVKGWVFRPGQLLEPELDQQLRSQAGFCRR